MCVYVYCDKKIIKEKYNNDSRDTHIIWHIFLSSCWLYNLNNIYIHIYIWLKWIFFYKIGAISLDMKLFLMLKSTFNKVVY